MDWSQASQFELSVFGVGVLFTFLIVAVIIVVLIRVITFIAWRLASRIGKRMNTTKALKCDFCEYKKAADGNPSRCGRFDINIVEKSWPNGCTWGVKKSKIEERR